MNKNLLKYKKLNYGCGWDKRKNYLNLDIDASVEPDLLIKDSAYSLLPKKHYNEILARDVLEHIPRSQTLSTLLEWSEYLKPRGILNLQTSSVLGVAKQLSKKKKFENQHGWLTCLFGNQGHEGDYHHNGFTEVTLRVYLSAAGFSISSIEEKDLWLFHVKARKEYDWTAILLKHQKKSDSDFIISIFAEAFGREPDYMGETHLREALESGSLTRYGALKHLLNSPERLYYTAKKLGI